MGCRSGVGGRVRQFAPGLHDTAKSIQHVYGGEPPVGTCVRARVDDNALQSGITKVQVGVADSGNRGIEAVQRPEELGQSAQCVVRVQRVTLSGWLPCTVWADELLHCPWDVQIRGVARIRCRIDAVIIEVGQLMQRILNRQQVGLRRIVRQRGLVSVRVKLRSLVAVGVIGTAGQHVCFWRPLVRKGRSRHRQQPGRRRALGGVGPAEIWHRGQGDTIVIEAHVRAGNLRGALDGDLPFAGRIVHQPCRARVVRFVRPASPSDEPRLNGPGFRLRDQVPITEGVVARSVGHVRVVRVVVVVVVNPLQRRRARIVVIVLRLPAQPPVVHSGDGLPHVGIVVFFHLFDRATVTRCRPHQDLANQSLCVIALQILRLRHDVSRRVPIIGQRLNKPESSEFP